jgi:hypothetical protein
MVNADEPSKPRRRRSKSHGASPVNPIVPSDLPPLSALLEEAIDRERVQLMQVHAMLKCLYEVLLYADGDDSIMHADVADVAARLIDESVTRLDLLRMQVARPKTTDAPAVESKEEAATVPPRNHQVKEPPAAYLC